MGSIVITITADKHTATARLDKVRKFAFLNKCQIYAKGNKKKMAKYSIFSFVVKSLNRLISTLLSFVLFFGVTASTPFGKLV